MTVRVRIAPSPTGPFHVGNARAALFNWLYARHCGGVFIVRIDDTDAARSDEVFTEEILSGLRWLGLDWDEGAEVGGPHGTYRQSDRFPRYQQVVKEMLEADAAYFDFRTPEDLEELRAQARQERRPPGYYIRRPADYDLEQALDRIGAGETAVVRFRVPMDQAVEFTDLVRGEVQFAAETVDDFVILRSDGSPTYHLASTVDDVDYEITHVARGEDLLSSTPKHILLTEAIGGQRPTYAHLPLLRGPDGRKLSKRHGDTALKAYQDKGFLPEAVFNYMCLLGWSLDPENEVFTREQAVAAFDLADVGSAPAVFDTEKLEWMSGVYMRALPLEKFREMAREEAEKGLGRKLSEAERMRMDKMAPLIQERVRLWDEIVEVVRFLFEDVTYSEASWHKVMKPGTDQVLQAAHRVLSEVSESEWRVEGIEQALREMLDEQGLKPRQGLQPIRVAVTGSHVSLPLFESIAALSQQEVLERLESVSKKMVSV